MNLLNLHRRIENHAGLLVFGILVVSSIGGLVQIVPSLYEESLSAPAAGIEPYPPLELVGRDIYIREGCSVCHSQQVRPLLAEVLRYGDASTAGEFVYDRPFLWGSKRTGPDLHRIGGKYSDEWHRIHMLDPRAVVAESIMPSYPWLAKRAANASQDIERRMQVLKTLGHPYTDRQIYFAPRVLEGKSELDAVVAYLQGLGVQPSSAESTL